MIDLSYAELQPVVVFLALLSGAALGQFWRARWIRRNKARLRREAKQILIDAERTGKGTIIDAELEAKRILLGQLQNFDVEAARQREDLLRREELLNKRLEGISALQSDLEQRSRQLGIDQQRLLEQSSELQQRESLLLKQLESAAGVDQHTAKQQLIEKLKQDAEQTALHKAAREIEACRQNVERVSQELIATCVERLARQEASERSISMVSIEDDGLKGRIIGRDGRNVRAFEALTGVEIILDEIPHYAILSCHDPERRETARVALVNLIQDGRIQPARIEEFVSRAKQETAQRMFEDARQIALSFGLSDISDQVLSTLGRLRLRSSFAQNVLLHSVECAQLARFMAAELNLDPAATQALVRAALLHDIGKALGQEHSAAHALSGAEFLGRNGESELVCNLVAAHHNQVEDRSILCALIRAIDAISGARPGARREDYQEYLKRLGDLENLALGFAGVTRAYAIQAGRELHVCVESNQIADQMLPVLAAQIARKIEAQFRSMGTIKVSISRESQAVDFATWAGESAGYKPVA